MSESLNNLPVTTTIRLKPKPGLKKEALNWFHKISKEAAYFKGHLGSEIKSHAAPKKWKMAIITMAVIFTFSNTLIPWLGDLFKPLSWHPLVNNLLGVIIMVFLMTYLVMPFMTKVFSRWLFRQNRST